MCTILATGKPVLSQSNAEIQPDPIDETVRCLGTAEFGK